MRLAAQLLEVMREHARAGYPEECCGALLGRLEPGELEVRHLLEAVPLGNESASRRGRRYLIPPAAVRHIEEQAQRRGLEVVGFYHSHPDHGAAPSEVDREQAWPWYVYLIIAVGPAGGGEARAWRLTDDRLRFEEESLSIMEEVR
ncbi:MAG: M67 family metallopeptidase [Gemmatimonadetes bacterium]|nr:M67 family metallopeptidase [Gemmatimonadota bacterium]